MEYFDEDLDEDFDDYLNNQDYFMEFPDYVAEQDEFQRKCDEWEEQERKDEDIRYLEDCNSRLWKAISKIDKYISSKDCLINKKDKDKIKEIIEECYGDGNEHEYGDEHEYGKEN